jgi:hypothetical protein
VPRPAAITQDELLELARRAPTVSLLEAGRALGYGANTTYEAAQRGTFPLPVIRVGRKMRVPSAALLAALGLDQETS